jgi:hypothetical protein
VGDEILHAEKLYNDYVDYDGFDYREEEALWNKFFDYARDHMRGWWD